MKRILILLLLFSMAVFPCVTAAEAQNTAAPENAEADDTAELTLFEIRYYFEHRLLPQRFYYSPEAAMDSLRGNGLYEMWRSYTAENTAEVAYKAEEFSTREMLKESGITVLMLSMPEPADTLLCYRIYLCYDPETGTAAYFTAEYDKYEGYFDEGCLLCGWNEDGTHRYYSESRILPDSNDPEYESLLAEEADIVLKLMQERIAAGTGEP